MEYGMATPPASLPKERNVLVLDLSKSMLAPLPDPSGPEKQKIEVARTAVYRILENAETTGGEFGLVTFTETVRVAVPLAVIHKDNLPYVESLISMLTPSGRSAIWDALAVGADLLRRGTTGVHGTLVLVTDGWDNASNRFEVRNPAEPPGTGSRIDLVPYMLPEGSSLTLRVIGIGMGNQRDKGVDTGRMNAFLAGLTTRAQSVGAPALFTYQEVDTGAQLFAQMVNAFLDVDYDDGRTMDQLHPEELARNAARAARALKEPQQHATVSRLTRPAQSVVTEADMPYSEAPTLEVDVVNAQSGVAPPVPQGTVRPPRDGHRAVPHERLRGRPRAAPPVEGGPPARDVLVLGGPDLLRARRDRRGGPLAPPGVERRGPDPGHPRGPASPRRLALLQAKMQNDQETETLVRFLDDTEIEARPLGPEAEADAQRPVRAADGAARHLPVDPGHRGRGPHRLRRPSTRRRSRRSFGLLQDARLENAGGDASVEGALDFIEICLAEMR